MHIPELVDFIYEDLEARITRVQGDQAAIEVFIVCDDPKEDRKRRFRIVCENVVEAKVAPGVF